MVLQALIVQVELGEEKGGAVPRSNIGSKTEVAKPQVFDRSSGKVSGFIITSRLYIRMRMRGDTVEDQT